jgi:hypothetical protein
MLFEILQVFAVILAALAMVPAAAHALELPGKMRLHRNEYIAVQSIYYPGFTLAGIGEAASIPATFVLLLLTQRHTASFGSLSALCWACWRCTRSSGSSLSP